MPRRVRLVITLVLVLGLPAALAASHVASLVDFSNGTIADANQVNANFEALRAAVEAGPMENSVGPTALAADAASLEKVSGGAMKSDGTNIGIGTAAGAARLDVAGTVRATGFVVTCAEHVKLVSARTYTTLNSELDANSTGATVCGAGWHVCNYQEATTFGVLFGCDLGNQKGWIVGGFSNSEGHRRSIWNYQDSVQCQPGNFPSWWGRWGPYLGRVHCEAGVNSYPVVCCVNR